MIGVNRTVIDGKELEYVRSFQVFNPNGELLKLVISENEMDIFNVDLGFAQKFKQIFFATLDRKPALYQSTL